MESGIQTHEGDDDDVEFEDVDLSDIEEDIKDEFSELHIDSNSQITSKKAPPHCKERDSCEMRFQDGSINFLAASSALDNTVLTSDEEIEVEAEDIQQENQIILKHLGEEGVCIAASLQSTNFKDEYSTNDEENSGDDNSEELEFSQLHSKQHKKLTAGVAVTNVVSAIKKMSSSIPNKDSKFSSRYRDLFSDHVTESDNYTVFCISNLNQPQPKPGLVTCLEFLSSQPLEDGLTDTEEFLDDLFADVTNNDSESVRKRVNLPFGAKEAANKRSEFFKKARNVAISRVLHEAESTDSGTDDEMLCAENEDIQLTKRTKKKHLKNIHLNVSDNVDGFTDEEELVLNPEWTETDDSGAIRQVTKIKTETSFKLDSDGKDLEEDGDDLISRTTATTTTRIVTTVTTDGNGESADRSMPALEAGDDLRHSVEIILDQFMSDNPQDDASQKE